MTTLLKVLVDSGTPASVKVRAADSILGHSAKAIELEDIEARVAHLPEDFASSAWRSSTQLSEPERNSLTTELERIVSAAERSR